VCCCCCFLLQTLPLPSATRASAVNAISRGSDILNRRSVFINDLVDTDILLSKSGLLNIYYAVVRSMMFHVNCGSNLVRILVNNLSIRLFFTVYTIVLCT
jgi:hypothetical protein